MPVTQVDAPASASSVALTGRLGARVDVRTLPSGDEVTTFTVVVDRPPGRGSSASVDAIPCQAFLVAVARRARSLEPGTWVRVEGVLRRRFWRAGTGLASAMEVEVRRLERCRVPR